MRAPGRPAEYVCTYVRTCTNSGTKYVRPRVYGAAMESREKKIQVAKKQLKAALCTLDGTSPEPESSMSFRRAERSNSKKRSKSVVIYINLDLEPSTL